MPTKKIRKKTYRTSRKNRFNKNLFIVFLLALTFASVFFTVKNVQQPQTIRQHAATDTSQIQNPVFGCIGLGGAECMAENTFLSDPANSQGQCVVVESA